MRVGNITDDILMRRASSLRQGLGLGGRRLSSYEEIGIPPTNHPVRLTLNGGIGLEVTPPEDCTASAPSLQLQGTIV